jgi:hypothetical protein
MLRPTAIEMKMITMLTSRTNITGITASAAPI